MLYIRITKKEKNKNAKPSGLRVFLKLLRHGARIELIFANATLRDKKREEHDYNENEEGRHIHRPPPFHLKILNNIIKNKSNFGAGYENRTRD